MSHSVFLLPPCPVQIGSFRNDSPEMQLHEYVKQGNYAKVKKMLKKGIIVDCINSLGQTALFVAALLGFPKMVDLLLKFGSDPNHRCFDGSTPVHAAAFSCNQWNLSKLIDAGGDLRLHDQECRTPYAWAIMSGKDRNVQMLEFIKSCSGHMKALLQCFPYKAFIKVDSSSFLIRNPSIIGLISQGIRDQPLSKCKAVSTNTMYGFGYGKLYLTITGRLEFFGTIPFVEEKYLVQGDDKLSFSYPAGPYMTMTSLLWGCTEVTVKELNILAHDACSKLRFVDLLIAEQEYLSKLHHPNLIQLIAVCVPPDLEIIRLVFERVTLGSLYSVLHERRSEFPILHMETLVHLLLQMTDALLFLHYRGYIHRSLTSHAVQIFSAGLAKISHFEYMIESKDGGTHSDLTHFPIPMQLYNWLAPEVILGKTVTAKCDIYSFCAITQESLTDTLPWDGLDGTSIKAALIAGHNLTADIRLSKPYDYIVSTGIQPKPKDRLVNLQDIRCMLKNDLKEIIESKKCTPDKLSIQNLYPEISIGLQPRTEISRELNVHDKELADIIDEHHLYGNKEAEMKHEEKYLTDPHHELFLSDDTSSSTESQIHGLEILSSFDSNLENKINNKINKDSNDRSGALHLKDIYLNKKSGMEISSSGTDEESNTEDMDNQSDEQESVCEIPTGQQTCSKFEEHMNSVLLHLNASLTMLQEATETLDKAELKLENSKDSNAKYCEECSKVFYSFKPSVKVTLDEVDNKATMLESCSGSLAVGPPVKYIPPNIGLHSKYENFQTQKDTTKILKNMGAKPKNKKWKGQSSFQNKNVVHQPNYQICNQDAEGKSSFYDYEDNWELSDKFHRLHASNSSEGFRVRNVGNKTEISEVLSSEVKYMAGKAASGKLFISQYNAPCGNCSSGESERLENTCQNMSKRVYRQKQHLEDSEASTDRDTELDKDNMEAAQESKLEKLFRKFAVRRCQLPEECNLKDPDELCGKLLAAVGQPFKTSHLGHNVSLDCSADEFFTPDHSDCSNYHKPDQVLNITEPKVTQAVCMAELASSIRRSNTKETGPGDECFIYQPVGREHGICTASISTNRITPNYSYDEAEQINVHEQNRVNDDNDKDISIIDIEELSVIQCDQGALSKQMISPRMKQASTRISTPVIAEKARSAVDSKMSFNTTFWESQDPSQTMSNTFPNSELFSSESGVRTMSLCSVLESPEKKSSTVDTGAITPSKNQKKVSFAANQHNEDEIAAHSLMLETTADGGCKNDNSLIDETCHTAEETDRAHSTLDDALETLLEKSVETHVD